MPHFSGAFSPFHYKVYSIGGETPFLAGLGVHPCHPVLPSTILAHYQKSTKQCQSILTAYHKVPECFVLQSPNFLENCKLLLLVLWATTCYLILCRAAWRKFKFSLFHKNEFCHFQRLWQVIILKLILTWKILRRRPACSAFVSEQAGAKVSTLSSFVLSVLAGWHIKLPQYVTQTHLLDTHIKQRKYETFETWFLDALS